MKNIKKLSFFLFAVILWNSCGQKEIAPPSQEISLESRLAACRSIAKHHSIALQKIYAENKIEEASVPLNSYLTKQSIQKEIQRYIKNKSVEEDLLQTSLKLHAASPTDLLRSSEQVDTIKVIRFIESFSQHIALGNRNINIERTLEKSIQTSAFSKMNTAEQNSTLLRLAIYEDSFKYWKENYPYWTLSNKEIEILKRKGGFTDWLSDVWKETVKVIEKDAKGPSASTVLGAGAAGAVAGGLGGAAAGGIGAGPGAAGGAILGMVGSMVEQAVEASASSTLEKKDDGKKEKENNKK